MRNRSQRGISLIETLVVIVVASLALVTTTAYSLPLIAREGAKSSIYETQAMFQLAKVEALNRNSICYVEINTRTGRVKIKDTMGTGFRVDDETLHTVLLPSGVEFESPNAEPPIDLIKLGGPASKIWIISYSSYGAVTSAGGHIMFTGGERFLKLSVFKAGGTRVEHWNGSSWKPGA